VYVEQVFGTVAAPPSEVVEHSFDFPVDIEQLFDTMTTEHPFDRLVGSLRCWGTGTGAGVSHPLRRLTSWQQ